MKLRNHVFYGPDRVGKTSLTEALLHCIGAEEGVIRMHFSGPRPGDVNPIMQYLDPLQRQLRDKATSHCHQIWDRGVHETVYYEKMRRNADIPQAYVEVMEHTLDYCFPGGVRFYVLHAPWDLVEPRHEEELREGVMSHMSMEERKREHDTYYETMHLLQKRSVLSDRWLTIDMEEWQDRTTELAKYLHVRYHFGLN